MDSHLLRFTNKTLVFTDLETCNLCLNINRNTPWQATTVTVKGDNIIEEYDAYVKWDKHIPVGVDAARITRYDHQKVTNNAIHESVVFKELFNRFQSADYIVGHNIIGFDAHLLKGWYQKHGKNFLPLMSKIIDTNCFAKGIKLEIPFKPGVDNLLEYQLKMYHRYAKGIKTRLEVLGKEHQIEHNYEMLHDALCDLRLNVKVWNKMKYHIEI